MTLTANPLCSVGALGALFVLGACSGKVIFEQPAGDPTAGDCANRVKDGAETGVDCGGSCGACQLGDECTTATDCESGICTAGHCQQWQSCGNGVVEGPELCDQAATGGHSCISLGFEGGGSLACNATCDGWSTTGCLTAAHCGDALTEGPERCDGTDLNTETCETLGYDGGALACNGDCTDFVTTACTTAATCGDGVRAGPEICDGGDLASKTCVALGYDSGSLRCKPDCTGYDTGLCVVSAYCGNTVVDGGEACDGAALGNETCETLGYDGGLIACAGDCTYDTLGCQTATTCGDNVRAGPEACDGGDLANQTCAGLGFTTGVLGCTEGCAFDTALCSRCGDGAATGGEVCDGDDLKANTCRGLGFEGGGVLDCAPTCDAFVTTDCVTGARCGDGVATGPEQCDADDKKSQTCVTLGFAGGNLGCSGGCTFDTSACYRCGDGTPNGTEQCDDGNLVDDDDCRDDCTRPSCGDGLVASAATTYHETCDEGAANSDTYSATRHCNASCTGFALYCGDGLPGGSEACDEGAANSDAYAATQHCNASCSGLALYCGDGLPGGSEACDDGAANSDTYAASRHCNTSCSGYALYCGDGLPGGSETCDDGAANSDAYAASRHCNTACSGYALYCGDGLPGGSETCDEGAANSDAYAATQHCNASCTGFALYCGDGLPGGSEACDDGAANSDAYAATRHCNISCSGFALYCGDGLPGGSEACDDGAANSDAYAATRHCNASCSGFALYCGDGLPGGSEACDDGAANSDAYAPAAHCNALCSGFALYCGDGLPGGSEVCDEGSTTNGTYGHCNVGCSGLGPRCADGVVQWANGEQCDDANGVDNDSCRDNCKRPGCGDGFVSDLAAAPWTEVCDLGAANDDLGNCTTRCTRPACGDGVWAENATGIYGEFCDGLDLDPTQGLSPPPDCTDFPPLLNGVLQCDSDCTAFDTSACVGCGNDRIDNGERCDGTALGGAGCSQFGFTGGTLQCNPSCSGYLTTACTGGCGDGSAQPTEACDPGNPVTGTPTPDLKGQSCASFPPLFGPGLACTLDCSAFDKSACAGCGNGVREGAEACDGLDTAGATCLSIGKGYTGGVLGACSANCLGFDESGCHTCGNGTVETARGELCDGQNLDGKRCTDLIAVAPSNYFDGGELSCAEDCLSFDTDLCLNCGACPGGQTCVDGACACPTFLTDCSGACKNLTVDPLNCGACGTACGGTDVCYGGKCVTSTQCAAPLVACTSAHLCVDPKTDSAHCGATGGANCGTLCSSGFACIDGTCSNAIKPVGPAPAKCVGGGPAISTGLGGALECAGDLAAVTFRWALCACHDVSKMQQGILTDGFNSSIAPYAAPRCVNNAAACMNDLQCPGSTCKGGTGAGLGANGYATFGTSGIDGNVFGTVWTANKTGVDGITPWGNVTSDAKKLFVDGDVRIGGNLAIGGGGGLECNKNLFVVGSGTGSGVVEGTIYCANWGSVGFTGAKVPTPGLTVPDACDCSAGQLIDVAAIISAHRCTGATYATCPAGNNDNASIQLDPDVFQITGGRLDLDCGYYYLTQIAQPATIVVHGRAALFIGGNIQAGSVQITLDAAAELDIFVLGSFYVNAGMRIGSPAFTSRTRLYVAGTVVDLVQPSYIASNIYAPNALASITQDLDIYGGLFAKNFSITQPARIHFDTGVVKAGDYCPPPCGNGQLDAGEQCDGTVFGAETCVSRGFAGGSLVCVMDDPTPANNCKVDDSGCYECGDGLVNGGEDCEGAGQVGGADGCTTLGYTGGDLYCFAASCTYDTTRCYSCGNGVIEAAEQCDGSALNGVTCQTLGYDGGTVSCNGLCQRLLACYRCGDAVLDPAELCDPATTDPADDLLPAGVDCASLGFTAGAVHCQPNCSYDTSGCTRCGNYLLESGEACDGNNLAGQTCNSPTLPGQTTPPFDGGTLACGATCAFDLSLCARCGNDAREPGEQCDAADLGGATCETLGFVPGPGLSCNSDCTFDNDCTLPPSCGDGLLDTLELCDPGDPSGTPPPAPITITCQDLGFTGGTITVCDADCTPDTSGCTRCGNNILEAGEECDGNRLNGAACPDQGTVVCTTSCTLNYSGCRSCGDGLIQAPEICDPGDITDGNPAPAFGGQSCSTAGYDGGDIACTSACALDLTACYRCGDGTLDATESCDPGDTTDNVPPPDLGGKTCSTYTSGSPYWGGTLACFGDCSFNPGGCRRCGDGRIDAGRTPPEECDLTNLNGQTCVTLGLTGTGLSCNADCTFDTSACGSATSCGDGVIDPGEVCDPGGLGTPPAAPNLNNKQCTDLGYPGGGTLSCTAGCAFNTSLCKQCNGCRDCNNQACINNQCTECVDHPDCCSPLKCVGGECVLF
ncbi:MAG: hypothetical protein HY903_11995 [Deltaproteobacteria bacterium]|nr:hypothetical protein [Deltaproteobacteria bacterium]